MAGPVSFLARTQLRRRWRALVALTLFVGLFGGLSVSLIAGSRRSSTVVDRYLSAAHDYTFEFFAPELSRQQLLATPGVVRADPQSYLGAMATTPDGRPIAGINGQVVDFAAADPTTRILAGHAPDGSDPNEVVVNQAFVKQFGKGVGDSIPIQMFRRDQEEEIGSGIYTPKGPRFEMPITAVVRAPQDIAGDEVTSIGASSADSSNFMLVSEAFFDAHHNDFLDFGKAYSIQLRDGLDGRAKFLDRVNAQLPEGADEAVTAPAQVGERRASLDAPVDLETSALLALGVGLAIVGAITLTLVLRAEQRTHEQDTPALRTLGFTVPQLECVAALRTLPLTIGGAVLAFAVALALSGRYPIGIGRQIELDSGFDLNVAVLGLGLLVIVVFVAVVSFVLGRPRPVRTPSPTSRLTMARWFAKVGAPTDVTLGTQLAFERGRGVRSVPARQAVIGGAVALAIVTALAVYIAGVGHLYSGGEAHGWPWDASIGNTNFPISNATVKKLAADRRITRMTKLRYGDAQINGRYTELLAFDASGDAPPEVIAGRLPETAAEVALGRVTMDKLGVELGSTVKVSIAGGEFEGDRKPTPRQMRVVGVALSRIFGESDLGQVGLITMDGVRATGGDTALQLVALKVGGQDPQADLRAIRADYTEDIDTDAVPARIVNLQRVRRLPLIGLALAGLLGTILLIYTLTISARARSRELAVLRTLGLPSRRVRSVLAWQGVVLATGMLLVGIPIGLIAGSASWHRVASGLGVREDAVFSPFIALLVPLALVVAVGASLYPARRARRLPVADLLRVE